jgi:hypothetical protein
MSDVDPETVAAACLARGEREDHVQLRNQPRDPIGALLVS